MSNGLSDDEFIRKAYYRYCELADDPANKIMCDPDGIAGEGNFEAVSRQLGNSLARQMERSLYGGATTAIQEPAKPLTYDDFINAYKQMVCRGPYQPQNLDIDRVLGQRRVYYLTSPHLQKTNDKGERVFLLAKAGQMLGAFEDVFMMHDENEATFTAAIYAQGWMPVKISGKKEEESQEDQPEESTNDK